MATDEIITRYKIELDQLKAEVAQLVAQYGKADDAAERSGKKAQKAFNDSAKAGNKFFASLGDIATGIVAAFSVRQVIAFAGATIKAFEEAEKSSEKLKFAVISLGKEGAVELKKLEKQAKALSAGGGVSFFDDDDIKKSQAMLIQFGLTADQVEKLTPGILDLAVAMDQDLGTATNTTLSALTGMTRSLKEVGGDFKDTGSTIGNYNKTLEVFAKVQGTATSALETTSGALKELENISGDVDEAIGEKLAPALLNLKSLALDLKDALASAVVGLNNLFFGDATKKAVEFGNESKKALQDSFKATLQYVDSSQLEDRLDAVIRLFNEQEAASAQFRKDKNAIGVIRANELKIEYAAERDAIFGILDARKQGLGGFQKIISDTSKLNKKELQDYVDGLKLRTDSGKKFIEDEIVAAEKRIEDIDKLNAKALEDAIKQREDALKKLQDLELSYSQQRKEALAKDELELIEIRKQAAIKQANDLLKQAGGGSNAAAVSANTKALADIELIFAKETADKKVEIEKKSSDEMDKILDDLTKENERLVNIDYNNWKKAQDDKAKAAEEAAERIKQAQKEAIDNSIQLVGVLMDIEANLQSQRLIDLESQREQDRVVSDEQQQKLQDDLNNRLITQAQYEKESAKLKDKRVTSEKEIEKKINEERRKADQAAKDRAIFEAAISAALAVVKQLAATPLPAGAPFIALVTALGLAQVAAVASRPLPKYAEGTRYLDRSGNKRGKDTIAIMADEGERIIPRKQNVKHWKLYNSIDDGSFDKLIHDTYVLPALVAAQKSNQKQKQETFAENIAKSFMGKDSSGGNDFYELRRLWNKGIYITNLQDMVSDDIKSPYR